jgi:hypothetical protein
MVCLGRGPQAYGLGVAILDRGKAAITSASSSFFFEKGGKMRHVKNEGKKGAEALCSYKCNYSALESPRG